MTNAEKIEWLNSYKEKAICIRVLEDDAEEPRETFGDAGQYYGRGYHNSDLYKSLKGKFQQIAKDKRAAVIHQKRVKASIEAVPDEECRQLLTLRYIEGMKWDDIAKVMTYEEGYIRNGKHKCALKYIQIPSQKEVKQS